jgi:hypothetical protein
MEHQSILQKAGSQPVPITFEIQEHCPRSGSVGFTWNELEQRIPGKREAERCGELSHAYGSLHGLPEGTESSASCPRSPSALPG